VATPSAFERLFKSYDQFALTGGGIFPPHSVFLRSRLM